MGCSSTHWGYEFGAMLHRRDIDWWLCHSVGTNEWFYHAIGIQVGYETQGGDMKLWLSHRVGI